MTEGLRAASMVALPLLLLAGGITWGPWLTVRDAPVPLLRGPVRILDGGGLLEGPVGVAISPAGLIYASDAAAHRIVVFDGEGRLLRTFGGPGRGPGHLRRPMHLSLTPEGLLLVAEYGNDRLSLFTEEGDFVRHIVPRGVDAPAAALMDDAGRVYVADFYHHRVLVGEAPYERWVPWGGPGRLWGGSLHYPTDLALGRGGGLWVADAYNDRLQLFREGRGVEIAGWGFFGLLFGLRVATGVDIDPAGRLWATDFEGGRLWVFDGDGTPLGRYARPGAGRGALNRPTDVAVAGGLVAVADYGNARVQVWALAER